MAVFVENFSNTCFALVTIAAFISIQVPGLVSDSLTFSITPLIMAADPFGASSRHNTLAFLELNGTCWCLMLWPSPTVTLTHWFADCGVAYYHESSSIFNSGYSYISEYYLSGLHCTVTFLAVQIYCKHYYSSFFFAPFILLGTSA